MNVISEAAQGVPPDWAPSPLGVKVTGLKDSDGVALGDAQGPGDDVSSADGVGTATAVAEADGCASGGATAGAHAMSSATTKVIAASAAWKLDRGCTLTSDDARSRSPVRPAASLRGLVAHLNDHVRVQLLRILATAAAGGPSVGADCGAIGRGPVS